MSKTRKRNPWEKVNDLFLVDGLSFVQCIFWSIHSRIHFSRYNSSEFFSPHRICVTEMEEMLQKGWLMHKREGTAHIPLNTELSYLYFTCPRKKGVKCFIWDTISQTSRNELLESFIWGMKKYPQIY